MEPLKINFDALKKDNWSEKELENVELMVDFVQNLMNNHDFDYIMKKYGDTPYVQHNRNIPEGINGIVGFLKQFSERFPEFNYDVKHILADGDYVMFHSHATTKKKDRGNDKKGLNIKDTWKIKDGKIVEHWDAIQSMDGLMRLNVLLNGGTIRNGNGVY